MEVRFASANDAQALLEIYAQYIDTPITFECTLPTAEEFAGRIRVVGEEYPYLICEADGRIAGYAYAHRQMARDAYGWNAELSVYLDQCFVSRGYGKTLYNILMGMLKLQGVKNVYGGVTVPNEASERLHASLGFARLGTYHSTGYKGGRWHDVAWFEKAIGPHDLGPAPFLPIRKIPMQQLAAVIQECMGKSL